MLVVRPDDGTRTTHYSVAALRTRGKGGRKEINKEERKREANKGEEEWSQRKKKGEGESPKKFLPHA